MEAHKKMQRTYLGVFFALAVLTLLEVAVTYVQNLPRIPVLVPMALIKAALVVLFYMHLKYDQRVFSAIFVVAVLGAAAVMVSFILLFMPPLLDVK
ncbi:MAG: cytochrome C oxidase subunit IV family protein [Chloroflexota bacterium]|nr:cytochrome C oxidase subunit IV family protein [Chloroflexota bacterium]